MQTLVSDADIQMAPCLKGSAISASAQSLVQASRTLGVAPWASALRAWCVPTLFHAMERILASGTEPMAGINSVMDGLADTLRSAGKSGLQELNTIRPENASAAAAGKVEEVTGEHYGRLFEAFSSRSYWDEPVRLLRERLERNGVDISNLGNKTVLDAGCGGGRYTVAWKLLGTKSATGFDVSTTGLTDARQRVKQAGIEGVSFEQGNVLELPYANNTFDIVYSNGVLHHTVDWEKGVHEIVRVLKPGGLGWLYLIENPGGLFWDIIEVLRVIMKDEKRETARAALRTIEMPANRIFYMLDHVMVPINVRLTPKQISDCLAAAGATQIRRLNRGTDFDRVEQIYQKKPHAEAHFGVGENRFVFSKA